MPNDVLVFCTLRSLPVRSSSGEELSWTPLTQHGGCSDDYEFELLKTLPKLAEANQRRGFICPVSSQTQQFSLIGLLHCVIGAFPTSPVSMASAYASRTVIPNGYPQVLKDFTREVLRNFPAEEPADPSAWIYEFASRYFADAAGGAGSAEEADFMSPAEMEAQIREIFLDADKDQNGFLDRHEFKAVSALNYLSPRRQASLQPSSISALCRSSMLFATSLTLVRWTPDF